MQKQRTKATIHALRKVRAFDLQCLNISIPIRIEEVATPAVVHIPLTDSTATGSVGVVTNPDASA